MSEIVKVFMSIEQNKLTNKIESEAWKHGKDLQIPEVRGRGIMVKRMGMD